MKLHIPVARIEAGLRSFNRDIPEEHNRVLSDHLSNLLFCPTQTAVKNLENEGITKGVSLVGDVMYDSMLYNIQLAAKRPHILDNSKLKPKNYAFATVHHDENTDNHERLKTIFYAFEQISPNGLQVIIPLHPRTRQFLKNLKLGSQNSKLCFIDPVSYLDMLVLEKNAQVILTDSVGVQNEAYWFEVPCVTLKGETEWVETVDATWNVVAGASLKKIVDTECYFKRLDHRPDVYGDGRAAERIVEILLNNCLEFSDYSERKNNCQKRPPLLETSLNWSHKYAHK